MTGSTVLRSTDLGEARDVVAAAFCPHTLELPERATSLAVRYRAHRLEDLTLTVLDYGAPVRITTQGGGDAFLVEVPLGGRSTIVQGTRTVVADRSTGAVLDLGERITTVRSAGSPQLIVRIERGALERQLQLITGIETGRPLRLAPALDLRSAHGRTWRRLVELLRAETEQDGALVGSALLRSQLRSLLLSQLLTGQPGTHTDRWEAPAPAPVPKVVQRAVELLHAHASEPLTVEDVAVATGVSVRSLQVGFRRHLGTTPTEYLRDVRLDRVHAALREGTRPP